ncbi:ROK family protein (putative glucokinase) [Amphibacillus marinus]|uniref:ROK family protein (Putative glucokinase) n=1 Tax=Amphibacillus marinus TaxID=872970 RepID=A0A1H8MKU0_9BACI|nr:ROK family transcriptional regulator [Amphibacillus marinus]SEO17848.1 ROK family protein (putative glucokinase) [Amphibacillus marinus]
MQRGSFKGMKSLNKSIILTKILNEGPISRAQIAKDTQLTPPTVGSLVKELIDQRIVKESTQGTSKGGRKPTMLVIDQQAYYMIGIDAGPSQIDLILTDLSGKIIANAQHQLLLPITDKQFLTQLIHVTEAMVTDHVKYSDHIIGIGVAMHGVVDANEGESLYAPNLNLRDMPIAEALSNHFSYMVKVENDARALALAETWFGQGKGYDRLVAVNIGTGVGAGVVIEGDLYHGETFIAGEIGHMTIDLNGARCSCGNYGCWQTVISGPSIATRTKQFIKEGMDTSLTDLTDVTAFDVFEAAEAGDTFAQKILTETGYYIGVGLTNLIHTINPSQIILNGGVMKANTYLMPIIKETIAERVLTRAAKDTLVTVSELGDHATALGAVALILVELFAKNGELEL